jgi:periplasmic copper chaperone A
MMMQEVDRIDLTAGVPLELAPGGFHIMLLDLVAPLEVGSTFEITLRFAVAGEVVVPVEVRSEAP